MIRKNDEKKIHPPCNYRNNSSQKKRLRSTRWRTKESRRQFLRCDLSPPRELAPNYRVKQLRQRACA